MDLKYERNHSSYWYVVNNADQFDPQETVREVQNGLCSNAENLRAIKEEGFSYEYHYKTNQGRALADFKIANCPEKLISSGRTVARSPHWPRIKNPSTLAVQDLIWVKSQLGQGSTFTFMLAVFVERQVDAA